MEMQKATAKSSAATYELMESHLGPRCLTVIAGQKTFVHFQWIEFISNEMPHSTEVAFALLTQRPRVRFPTQPKIFLYCLVCGRPHLVLIQGISQMQLAVKA